jgi:hypothetical protein
MIFYTLLVFSNVVLEAQLQTSHERSNIGSCPKLTRDDFGRSDILSAEGIVAKVLQNEVTEVQVRIVEFNKVCEAAGLKKDTISSISAIITYEYADGPLSAPINRTEQFQLDCTINIDGEGSFSPPRLLRGDVRTLIPNGTLDTALNNKCGECVDSTIFHTGIDIDTHCFRT